MRKRDVCVLFVIVSFILIGTRVDAAQAAVVSSPFSYYFGVSGILHETGSMAESSSPYFWLNSGGILNISDGRGRTIQGNLSSSDKWRLIYLRSNPIDTDQGYHPQNLFRLITRSKWQNFSETAYFRITKNQISSSPNRDVSNGLLLFSRYQDGNNLYYAGIRVDGNAVIKKKLNGRYYTLASKKIFTGVYNRDSNPSLLPKNKWMGLKSMINTSNGKVNIKLYLDRHWNLNWTLVLEADDYSSPILNEGHAGIRTDFMDVEFDNFLLAKA